MQVSLCHIWIKWFYWEDIPDTTMSEKSRLLNGNSDDYTVQGLYSSINESDRQTNGQDNIPGYSINNSNAVKPVQKSPTEIKVYTRRFYILFMFSMCTLTQACVWNTWGPISQSAKHVFGWNDGDIALLANWGPISFIISLHLFSWILDVKGLRWACVSCSFVCAAGAASRCITFEQPWATWLIHFGQFLNGLGGPVAMAASTVISSTWFPSNQRTTSTSIGNLCNSLGVAVSFIIGPLLVPQHPPCPPSNSSDHNISEWLGETVSDSQCYNNTNNTDYLEQTKADIARLQYIECGFAVAVFLGILLYFPSKPPLPPSNTASIKRVDFKAGTLALLRHKQFWIISSIYGICLGVANTWMSVLDVDLNPLGLSQNDVGWMGFYSIIAGTIAAFIVARFADIFAKRMKVMLIFLYLAAAAVLTWLALISSRIIFMNKVYVWITVIAGNALVTCGVPLLYELTCEVTYPISEAVTTSALTMYNNVAGLIFLLVMMIPDIGVSWTNWCVLGTVLFCVPLLVLLKDRYNRLDLDLEIDPPDEKIKAQAVINYKRESSPHSGYRPTV